MTDISVFETRLHVADKFEFDVADALRDRGYLVERCGQATIFSQAMVKALIGLKDDAYIRFFPDLLAVKDSAVFVDVKGMMTSSFGSPNFAIERRAMMALISISLGFRMDTIVIFGNSDLAPHCITIQQISDVAFDGPPPQHGRTPYMLIPRNRTVSFREMFGPRPK